MAASKNGGGGKGDGGKSGSKGGGGDAGDTDGDVLVRVKRLPKRKPGKQTHATILAATAALLEEVGFERLSTNMICAKAGVTPPALYHYFPNKYAILFELAHNLLGHQRDALREWLETDGFGWASDADGCARIGRLLVALRAVADNRPGALWIMRALRAIPALQEVRGIAQKVMLGDVLAAMTAIYTDVPAATLAVPARLTNEIIHLGIEIEMDGASLDIADFRANVAMAVIGYLKLAAGRQDR